jgi:polar amino acid transport system substrate-binding protein
MRVPVYLPRITALLLLVMSLAACGERSNETAVTAVPPTPTVSIEPTVNPVSTADDDFLIIATGAPDPPFSDFDQFGEVIGFNEEAMASIAAVAGFDGYEFVVTPHEGVLDSLAQQSADDFDAVMSVLVIPDEAPEGLAYTSPYLEIGEVLVVLADDTAVQNYQDLPTTALVGVKDRSRGEAAAREVMGLTDERLRLYPNDEGALQALINEEIQAVVLDNYVGEFYSSRYPEQLRVVGDSPL